VIEVLGSTETGGVASRLSPAATEWTPLPEVNIHCDDQGQLWVSSPFISETDFIPMSDRAVIHKNGSFILQERIDRIVKIEGKRISLSQIEQQLMNHEIVREAVCLKLEGHREYIGAVIQLSPCGHAQLVAGDRRELNRKLADHLRSSIEAIAIPRKWRYCEIFPENTQGKITRDVLLTLFTGLET
jgi:acyl-coenzyme A synthetase/AMP-(fatty) acid ligase